ncbi:MAG TPA: response regulator transcription factor [Acidimicrobiia bacterium]
MDKQRILVVDDEPELRNMLRRYLEAEGFDVAVAADGETALSRIRNAPPDLMVLDVGLPGADGLAVLRETRSLSEVPVIMLTARAEEVDRVVGLTIGADDYIAKPFSPRELVARVRAVLRRGVRGRVETDESLQFEGLGLDLAGRQVGVDGRGVDLSALEFDLLAALASAPGRVFTRAQLLERVWGWDYFGPERVVDVHIGNIRKILGDDAADPRFIATVRGVGYKFVATPR